MYSALKGNQELTHYLLHLNYVIINYIFESIKGTHTHTHTHIHSYTLVIWAELGCTLLSLKCDPSEAAQCPDGIIL